MYYKYDIKPVIYPEHVNKKLLSTFMATSFHYVLHFHLTRVLFTHTHIPLITHHQHTFLSLIFYIIYNFNYYV